TPNATVASTGCACSARGFAPGNTSSTNAKAPGRVAWRLSASSTSARANMTTACPTADCTACRLAAPGLQPPRSRSRPAPEGADLLTGAPDKRTVDWLAVDND